jgi:hypothetical protein
VATGLGIRTGVRLRDEGAEAPARERRRRGGGVIWLMWDRLDLGGVHQEECTSRDDWEDERKW